MNTLTVIVLMIMGIMLFAIAYCMHRIEKHKEALAEMTRLRDAECKEKISNKDRYLNSQNKIRDKELVIERLERENRELKGKVKNLENHIRAEKDSYEKKLKTLNNAYMRLKRQKLKAKSREAA